MSFFPDTSAAMDRTPQSLLWDRIREALRARISADAWERWFSAVDMAEAREDAVVIRVPDSIHQLWIEMNYQEPLIASCAEILKFRPSLVFLTTGEGDKAQPVFHGESATGKPKRPTRAATPSRNQAPPVMEIAPEATLPPTTVADTVPVPAPTLAAEMDDDESAPNGLTPDRTFQNFVVGVNNQFAHAAATAVAAKPGRAYNPLFLYGGTGLGKTHLMLAVGAHIRETRPKARVVYITSEEFTNLFIAAIQEHSLPRFRKRFRQADVLLIDDIQFLAGKERSQEEFFHTFNSLFDGNKQIVLSSDSPPSELRNLEARLKSRCEWGLTAEVTPPDEETRVAILRKRAEGLRVEIPSNVIDYLASRIRSNVRRLHGSLFRVASWTSLHGPISLSQTEDLLRDLLQEESRNNISIDRIQKAAAEGYDIRLADMTSRKRPANIALARQVAMYLARDLTGSSYQEIGDAFGGRDHGTIMHACRSIEKRLREDEAFRRKVDSMTDNLRRAGGM